MASKRCAFSIRNPNTGISVCITPIQHKRLWGSACNLKAGKCPPPVLGCGMFGCAFPGKAKDRIVKITSDPSDVQNAIRAAGLPSVPKLYDAFQIDPTHYALVTERISTVTGNLSTKVNQALECFENYGVLPTRKATASPAPARKSANERARQRCCIEKPDKLHPSMCGKLAQDLIDAKIRLGQRGLTWLDIKAANIGWNPRMKRWQILDLGAAENVVPTLPTQLNGTSQKKRRRR